MPSPARASSPLPPHEDIRLRYVVARFDGIDYWNFDGSDVPAGPKPNHVWHVVLFSPDLGVHICSSQASAELWDLYSYATWDDPDAVTDAQREAWDEFINDQRNEETCDYSDMVDVKRALPGLVDWLGANPEPEDVVEAPPEAKGRWIYVGWLPSIKVNRHAPFTSEAEAAVAAADAEHAEAQDGLIEHFRCNWML